MEDKNLIFRILGNDIFPIHSNTQTYDNLLFTIKNEPVFENTDKIYLLNNIIDKNKRQSIVDLLEVNSVKFIELSFNYDNFRNLPKLSDEISNICETLINDPTKLTNAYYRGLSRELSQYRLLIMNINYARNFCIKYGKEHMYKWTFVFDSNIFLTTNYFNLIINNILPDTEYITIPQVRLLDGKYSNEIVLTDPKVVETLPIREHQIAFASNSTYTFNENIPYGTMNKAEFLIALQVPGVWSQWVDLVNFGISQRKFKDVRYQTLSKCIRLSPGVTTNSMETNRLNRLLGTYILYKQLTGSE